MTPRSALLRRRLRTLLAAVLAAHQETVPELLEARPGRVQLTSTGVLVVMLSVPARDHAMVLKLAQTPGAGAALGREGRVLQQLGGDPRLASFNALLPAPLAAGQIGVWPYRLDRALHGVPAVDRHRTAPPALLDAAATAVSALHRATATTVRGDDELAARWVDDHLDMLQRARARADQRRRVERLRDELRQAIVGQEVPVSWIHGDFWLGNVLVARPPDRTGRPTGIVDWEAAAGHEHPLHDLLHLLLFSRRLRSGQELGRIVCRQIAGGGWTPQERSALERHRAYLGPGNLSDRHALLLYWLRHAAVHARQQQSLRSHRYRVWEHRNVTQVLAAA